MKAYRTRRTEKEPEHGEGSGLGTKRGEATDLRQEQAHTYREPTVRGPNKPEPQKWGGHKHTLLGAYNKEPKIP